MFGWEAGERACSPARPVDRKLSPADLGRAGTPQVVRGRCTAYHAGESSLFSVRSATERSDLMNRSNELRYARTNRASLEVQRG
jgi:hypothetical protein